MRIFKVSPIPHFVFALPDRSVLKFHIDYHHDAEKIMETVLNSLGNHYSIRDFSWRIPTFVGTANASIKLFPYSSHLVDIECYDPLGRLARTVYSGFLPNGNYPFSVSKKMLYKDIYFLRLSIDGNVQVAKIINLQ